jgi:hypothetical protein
MSYSAQGWAQRQVFGSPILKGVMQALCYLMRDDELTVYAAVVNPEHKVSLEKLTEYEERAIRKALRDLVELGYPAGHRRASPEHGRLAHAALRSVARTRRRSDLSPKREGSGFRADSTCPSY